ncbi:PEP-CTERM sorting domain-containing protein [Calothrix membranacea FACHB-236]|nr:PEP-CTERM sorting domain-containing protein [Calothrix membranacea FACHB-236]
MSSQKQNSHKCPKANNFTQLITLALASTTIITHTLPAQAVTFNFTYDPGVAYDQKTAFEFAGRYWADYLSDDATVNIHVDFASSSKLPKGMLGGSIPAFVNNVSYNSFWNALNNDRQSQFDYTAVSNLSSSTQWQSNFQNLQQQTLTLSNNTITLTQANAKALNLIDKNSTALDGLIILNELDNTGYGWENSGYTSTSVNSWFTKPFDLYSVAVHEIGHILGFVSSLDGINVKNYNDFDLRKKLFTPFDLFRYSDSSKTQGSSDLSNSNASYFSIDSGISNIGYLSTGQDTSIKGDGFQGSHWKNYTNSIGVMAPALRVGAVREADERDLNVLDVIGWNRKVRTYSDFTLDSQAQYAALWAKEVNRNVDVTNMLQQNRWGGTSTTSTLNQTQDLVGILAQQGIFEMGGFWDTIDQQENVASVPEPATNAGLIGIGLLGLVGLKLKKFSRHHRNSI